MITHLHPIQDKSINSYQFIKEKQFTIENKEELQRESHKAQHQYSDFSEATYALLSKQKEVTPIMGHAAECQRLRTGLYWTESSNTALLAFKNDHITWIRWLSHHWLHSVEPSTGDDLNASESTLNKLCFDLLLRQVCEGNLWQPNLFMDFPLMFFKTHTQKNMSCKKPLSTRKKSKERCWAGRLSKGCSRLGGRRLLLVVFRASFA